jgi:hypothetical protein
MHVYLSFHVISEDKLFTKYREGFNTSAAGQLAT